MKTSIDRFAAALTIALLLPLVAFAQAAPAPALDPTTEQLLGLIKAAGGAFRAGMWLTGIIALVIAIVFVFRLFGKKAHDAKVFGTGWGDKPLWFFFDTKPGGILLNALASSGLVLTPLILAGQPMTGPLLAVTFGTSAFASQLWGWGKDLYEFWKGQKPDPAPAKAAGAAAAKDPGPTLNG